MAELKNPRWERFAQELFKGESQRKAYKTAYPRFKGKDTTADNKAYLLIQKDEIRDRLRELQEQEKKDAILSVEARKRILTNFAVDPTASGINRLKAIDLLNKMDSVYTTVIKGDVNVVNKLEDLL